MQILFSTRFVQSNIYQPHTVKLLNIRSSEMQVCTDILECINANIFQVCVFHFYQPYTVKLLNIRSLEMHYLAGLKLSMKMLLVLYTSKLIVSAKSLKKYIIKSTSIH